MLPRLDGLTSPGFVSIVTGKIAKSGCILPYNPHDSLGRRPRILHVFLIEMALRQPGNDAIWLTNNLTAEGMLAWFTHFNPNGVGDKQLASRMLEEFIIALEPFKTGNVLTITYPEPWRFELSKKSEFPKFSKPAPLP